jgi:hypothetical protein
MTEPATAAALALVLQPTFMRCEPGEAKLLTGRSRIRILEASAQADYGRDEAIFGFCRISNRSRGHQGF